MEVEWIFCLILPCIEYISWLPNRSTANKQTKKVLHNCCSDIVSCLRKINIFIESFCIVYLDRGEWNGAQIWEIHTFSAELSRVCKASIHSCTASSQQHIESRTQLRSYEWASLKEPKKKTSESSFINAAAHCNGIKNVPSWRFSSEKTFQYHLDDAIDIVRRTLSIINLFHLGTWEFWEHFFNLVETLKTTYAWGNLSISIERS